MEKKKSKAPIVVIIIILLAAAGFGYYKFVYQPQQMAKYELAESEVVETELVAETNWCSNEIDEYKEVFAAMAENDASYYLITPKYTNPGPRFEVYQTNKNEFSEKSPMNLEKAMKETNDGILKFLNYSYNGLPSPLYENINNNCIFGKLDVSGWAEEVIEPQFGGSVAEYFKSHELKLKCDDCTVTQIGIEIDEENNSIAYCYNITANVLTEDCIGDMSDLGIFANKGETKEVSLNVRCHYNENSKELFADIVLFE